MGKHRKAARSVAYQVKWRDGQQWKLAQVRGEKQRERLRMTLAALPWVTDIKILRVGK